MAPSSPRTRLDPELRRAQLLTHAIAVFAEHGIARATHSQVAESASVSVSAVYSYFRTRRDLVVATLAAVEEHIARIFGETLIEGLPADAALLGIARAFAAATRTDPATIKVWLDWSTGVGLEVWPAYLEFFGRIQADIETVIVAGKRQGTIPADVDVHAAARTYLGGGHSIALTRFAGAAEEEIEAICRQLVRGALGGAPVRAANQAVS